MDKLFVISLVLIVGNNMIKLNLFDYDDNSSHTFEFKSIEEVKETYSLTDEEVSEFLKGYKINPDHSDFTLHLIYKD